MTTAPELTSTPAGVTARIRVRGSAALASPTITGAPRSP